MEDIRIHWCSYAPRLLYTPETEFFVDDDYIKVGEIKTTQIAYELWDRLIIKDVVKCEDNIDITTRVLFTIEPGMSEYETVDVESNDAFFATALEAQFDPSRENYWLN